MKREEALLGKIKSLQSYRGLSNDQMGIKIHATGATYRNRMRDIKGMTVRELIALERTFGVQFLDTTLKIDG